MSFEDDEKMKEIPNLIDNNDDKSSYFKKIIPIYLFIVLIVNVSLIFEETPWYGILLLEIVLLILGALILSPWWIPKLPERQKNLVLQTIEKMEEKGHIEYEMFERPINCTAYSIGNYIFSFVWAHLLIGMVYLLSKIGDSDDTTMVVFSYIFFSFFFFIFVINPVGESKKGKDKIIVNPRNQTFIVRKNIVIFFYSKQKLIFPWDNVKFKIIPHYNPSEEVFNTPDEEKSLIFNEVGEVYREDKLKIFFSDQFESNVKLIHDDYREIIPKAFKALIDGSQPSKMIALKSLSMYENKISRRRIISYSICISIVIIEIILFILFL